ncbi:ribosomal RNA-processing protein 7 homolog A [Alligator sinensis]|uniref:Ribosomal RNA-processing protein 7 homolog A n=1 Tax=Alligator sinensis TaxID=38654 RepID=A0A1U7SQR7_ALLSI|nr:ribosomal RNA-processing protein 7 homolog A [Alligator sinensis]
MVAPAEKHVTAGAAPPGALRAARVRPGGGGPCRWVHEGGAGPRVGAHGAAAALFKGGPVGESFHSLPHSLEECLSRLFSRCGAVQSVQVCEKPGPGESAEVLKSKFFNLRRILGFRVAYVVFKNPSGAQAATSLSLHEPLLISSESCPVKTGILKWISCYAASLVNPEELKAEVDTFMQAYDQKVAEEEAKAVEEEGVPDEEGWVKVTRKGRRPGLPRTEAANLRALEREKRKKVRKELLNFYAWQHRETKREHIAQLRKKFEEDKQRIALMRAQRKFRPY